MDDLKGLLDKEGISIGRSDPRNSSIPTLTSDLLDNELIKRFEEQQQSTQQQSTQQKYDEINENPVDNNHADEIKALKNSQDNIELPVLDESISVTDENTSPDIDDYIADIDDGEFDVLEFAESVEQLEKTVQSITEPEDLQRFEERIQNIPPHESLSEQNPSPIPVDSDELHTSFAEITQSIHLEQLKEKLHKQLSFQIELSIAELKSRLLDDLATELDAVFKK